MTRGKNKDLLLVLGAAALVAGGWYAYRHWRRVTEDRETDEGELMIESYEAYSEGGLGPKPNGHHRKRRRWFHTEPVS